MTQAALGYLKSHGLLNHAARFDVVGGHVASRRETSHDRAHFATPSPPSAAANFFC